MSNPVRNIDNWTKLQSMQVLGRVYDGNHRLVTLNQYAGSVSFQFRMTIAQARKFSEALLAAALEVEQEKLP
jgi:hypothetical protein